MAEFTKKHLNKHFDAKVEAKSKQLLELRDKEVKEVTQSMADYVMSKGDVLQLEMALQKAAQAFLDCAVSLPDGLYENGTFSAARQIVHGTVTDQLISKFANKIANTRYSPRSYEDKTLEKWRLKGLEIFASFEKKKRELGQLDQELKNVIRTSTTAKQAYNNLVALGVDMSDFVVSDDVALTITKLSVNPCVLSEGGCKE